MKNKFVQLIVFTFLLSNTFLVGQQWQRTGGPIGGLGYNIKIHPTNNQIIYITDAFSGVHKSSDGGTTWVPKNNGITSRTGISDDAIPVFTIAIDQNNPTTIWAGTQFDSGIFKSSDSAENWIKKTNGITETNIVFREISVVNGDSNIVYASGEVPTGNQGNEFEKVKGVIYKTIDGGENWVKIWEGDSLARWLCIGANPTNLVSSTGIFDREANNITGVGILKSTDGGASWNPSNTGITGSLFVGGMSDSATPGLLYIATGNNAENNYPTPIKGGVFKSTNGGTSWTQVIAPTDVILPGYSEAIFTAVKIAPSNNDIVYAASDYAFYKSIDGGATWTGHRGGTPTSPQSWGPPGIRAGVPIEITIDKTNPDILYAANYGGGIFKSIDGAKTWTTLGKGYTGATIHKIAVDNQNSSGFIAVGRSGPFKSSNNGDTYTGLFYGDAGGSAEWYSAAVHPTNSDTMFVTDEHEGLIFKSTDGGQNWTTKFDHPNANAGAFTDRHGVKEIAISQSNPNVMYAGFAYQFFYNNPEDTNIQDSYGVYKSIDAGETWTEVGGLASIPNTNLNITALAINSTDENNVYVGLRETIGSGIYHSTDGGTTWIPIGLNLVDKSIFSITLAENNSVIYVGTKDNGVYKSTDNGTNWTQLLDGSGNKIITNVKVNPGNKNHIVASDMRSGIYASTNGGQNWVLTNTGLDNRAVTTLEFSRDGSNLFAGTFGGGIFTFNTSSLNLTSDQISFVKNVYPNPANDKIKLDLHSVISAEMKIVFYDITGKKVIEKKYTNVSNSLLIDTSNLKKGLYILEVRNKNNTHYKSKILIE
ncbi:putative secreted protein (Por secretion system target) [Lutibacter sp. Hel_I_33_5]|uniref:T9SS type A sorting domain-containing protein n=1 Tax=Lutibacter sp. Hel_I_33_5 TaxID=1566289 RepID=UPI00119D7DFC|nr:T9SS type A sorting domain-containing protein [Lutibacter sp. Hel_I_33_5]TVZ54891.1 putative secreted protein (Por secretion system target) [Lutibacter sp. Hel_I_33_5]